MTARRTTQAFSALFSTLPLDGSWRFAYTPTLDAPRPTLLDDALFSATMTVPGYWDDQTSGWRDASWWGAAVLAAGKGFECEAERGKDGKAKTNEHERQRARFLRGVGWYRRQVTLAEPPDGQGPGTVFLDIGELRHYAHVWVNREYVGCLRGHRAAWTLDVSSQCRPGAPLEITLAVGNDTCDTTFVDSGCFGAAGGIVGKVALRLAGPAGIEDVFVRAGADLQTVSWTCRIARRVADASVSIRWRVSAAEGHILAGGTHAAVGAEAVTWHTRVPEIRPWSPAQPHLYRATVELVADDGIVFDCFSRRFGMRQWQVDGTRLRLNGRTVFIVANCASSHFPQHVSVPFDKAYYLDYLAKLKALGFNTMKFLFMPPSLACLEAADELGLIVSPSVDYYPPAADPSYLERMEEEMGALARTYRNHVSVAIYRLSGERYCDAAFLGALERLARRVREAHPGALILPSHASRGIEYVMNLCDTRVAVEPFLHHPQRLRLLSAFADVIGRYPNAMLSYQSPGDKTWRDVDAESAPFNRPMLSHEIGMKASYLDLDNERRYTGGLPPVFYRRCREKLTAQGLLGNAPLYHRMSCRVQQVVRKYCIEENRLCRSLAGYEYLGCTDHFEPIHGYPCGFMDEFHALKPGETPAEIRRYQGESVLLLDFAERRRRAFWSGEAFAANWTVALFGDQPIASGRLSWELRDAQRVLLRNDLDVHAVPNGMVGILEPLKFSWPTVAKPARLTLKGRLRGDGYELDNQWDFWVFPRTAPPSVRAECAPGVAARLGPRAASALRVEPGARLHLRSELTPADVAHLESGGDVLLLGVKPFEARKLHNPLATGHSSVPDHNVGSILHQHAIFADFPHEGFGDWQCYPLLAAETVCAVFRDPAWPFDPILEIISSDKDVRRQACIFEANVGQGRLFVRTCPLDTASPSASALLDAVLRHVQSAGFRPAMALSPACLHALLETADTPPAATVERASLSCPAVRPPPACDGRMADESWMSAPAVASAFGLAVAEPSHAEQAFNAGAGVAGFTMQSAAGRQGAFKATVRAMHDEEYLYWAIVVEARRFPPPPPSTVAMGFADCGVAVSLPQDCGTYRMALAEREPVMAGHPVERLQLRLGITHEPQRMIYEVSLPRPQPEPGAAGDGLDVQVDVFHRESLEQPRHVITLPLRLSLDPGV